ncbi:MAG: hypothetical protein ABIF09_09630 [Gemmatimonadota bacterium]
MAEESFESWLRGRVPPIPAPFLPHLLERGDGPSGSMGLADRGTEVLSQALERPGRNREAAYYLLAADAFFTYACEAVAREGDVRAGLDGLLGLVGDRFS